jgi:hypothetical protein
MRCVPGVFRVSTDNNKAYLVFEQGMETLWEVDFEKESLQELSAFLKHASEMVAKAAAKS